MSATTSDPPTPVPDRTQVPPHPEDGNKETFARRMSKAVVAFATEDANGNRESLLGKVRRTSAAVINYATEDIIGEIAEAEKPGNQVAPEPDPNAIPADKPALKVILNDEEMSLLEQTLRSNLEGIASAVCAIILIYLVVLLVKFLSEYFSIDRDYVAMITAIITVEIMGGILKAKKTKNYIKIHLFTVWPTHIILTAIAYTSWGGSWVIHHFLLQ